MSKTFERFLRSFSDEELILFAHERAVAQPPYWRMLHSALRLEMSKRGLDPEAERLGEVVSTALGSPADSVSA